jgi:hypothetical protein
MAKNEANTIDRRAELVRIIDKLNDRIRWARGPLIGLTHDDIDPWQIDTLSGVTRHLDAADKQLRKLDKWRKADSDLRPDTTPGTAGTPDDDDNDSGEVEGLRRAARTLCEIEAIAKGAADNDATVDIDLFNAIRKLAATEYADLSELMERVLAN